MTTVQLETHCDHWFHDTCSSIPKAVFDAIDDLPNLLYVCEFCIILAKKTRAEPDALKQSIKKLFETLSVTISKEINPGMQTIINQQLANAKIGTPQFNRLIQTRIKSILECTTGNDSSRVNHDSSNEQKTLTNIVEYDPNNISVFRLGSYTEDAPHPGTLLIRFINK